MAGGGSFKDELKRRRKALDLTQAELAHAVGCSIYTLQHIEVGAARPSRQLAELLAAKLEIPLAERATLALSTIGRRANRRTRTELLSAHLSAFVNTDLAGSCE